MRFCFRQVLSQALEPTDGQIATAQDFLLGGKENPRSTQGFECLPFAGATRLFEIPRLHAIFCTLRLRVMPSDRRTATQVCGLIPGRMVPVSNGLGNSWPGLCK